MVDLFFLDGDEEGVAQEPVPPELEIARGWLRGEQTVIEVSSSPTIDITTLMSTSLVTAPANLSEAALSLVAPSSEVGS